jgi:CBS domain-containing protein
MMSSPLTVSPEMEIMRVVHLLVENDISGVPVVDKEGTLMGFVTERDCIRVALQAGYFDEIGDSVANYMTTDLRIVHPDDSLMEVGELFADSPFRRCPVVEDSRLIGLICRRDVLRALTGGAWFTHTTSSD